MAICLVDDAYLLSLLSV